MTAYLLSNHLFNFIAPAAAVALLLVLFTSFFARFSKHKRAAAPGFWTQLAIIFVANLAVLAAGLVVFGSDGRMVTYAALVLVAALCQWLLRRYWKTWRSSV